MFSRMFQTANVSDIARRPLRPVSLVGKYNWEFSEVSEESNITDANTTDASFTMTGTPKQNGRADEPKPDIVLSCHLLSNSNGTEFKYDIEIKNFAADWWDSGATHLVTAYKIVEQGADNAERNISLAQARIPSQCLFNVSEEMKLRRSWASMLLFLWALTQPGLSEICERHRMLVSQGQRSCGLISRPRTMTNLLFPG